MEAPQAIGNVHKKKARKTLVAIAVLAVAGLFVYEYVYPLFSARLFSFEHFASNAVVQEVKPQFSAPVPLRAAAPKATSSTKATPVAAPIFSDDLTVNGDIYWTNIERRNNGNLSPLNEDVQLDRIAKIRLDDMFAKQYFAHVSPASSSAITVAGDIGYDYLALGENLALGNFGGDEKVVEAWMASPGHRANILNSHYTNIGIAVRKGNFEGDFVWIAVQIFSRPASACPAVDVSLHAEIVNEQSQLDVMQADLASRKASIDNMPPGPENKAAVQAYNDAVTQYNAMVSDFKAKIAVYNSEVGALNACLGA